MSSTVPRVVRGSGWRWRSRDRPSRRCVLCWAVRSHTSRGGQRFRGRRHRAACRPSARRPHTSGGGAGSGPVGAVAFEGAEDAGDADLAGDGADQGDEGRGVRRCGYARFNLRNGSELQGILRDRVWDPCGRFSCRIRGRSRGEGCTVGFESLLLRRTALRGERLLPLLSLGCNTPARPRLVMTPDDLKSCPRCADPVASERLEGHDGVTWVWRCRCGWASARTGGDEDARPSSGVVLRREVRAQIAQALEQQKKRSGEG